MLDKNKVPKDLFGTESEVIDRLSKEFILTRDDAKAALHCFVKLGIILEESSISVPGMPSVPFYSYNRNFDWDAYEDSHYIKHRYLVSGSIGTRNFNTIVEWNKKDLSGLYSEIRKVMELSPADFVLMSISNLIEIGYSTEKE